MAGHLFALQGDIRRLACDAWLLPTDRLLRFVGSWFEGAPELARYRDPGHRDQPWSLLNAAACVPEGWSDGRTRTFELQDWPSIQGAPAATPWATDTGGDSATQDAWYLAALEEFVEKASARVRDTGCCRSKPLLAVPPIGTGAGGRGDERAGLLAELAQHLDKLAMAHDVDLAFVCIDPASYALFQRCRAQRREGTERHEALVARLSEHARRGTLVPFIGAGASVGAGLPDWRHLVEQLRRLAPAIPAAGEGEDLPALAQRIADQLGEQVVRERIRSIVIERSGRHSLIHGLLANLEPEGAITTNFDCLFETALSARGLPEPSVLRHKPNPGSRSWLLKMHGDVNALEDLVFTSRDYQRFGQRGALLGIVQAMLMTKHLLFVGYGLRDESFIAGVRSVVEAMGSSTSQLGTVLAYGGPSAETPAQFAVEPFDDPREIEVLLDEVVARADLSASFFLDERYSRALSTEERELAGLLSQVAALRPRLQDSAAWPHVEELLERLGWRGGSGA